MNETKLTEATRRLELLYWDCHRNGGPDVEVLAILRLCEEAQAEDDEPCADDVYELAILDTEIALLELELAELQEDDEIVVLELNPPRPPAA